MRILYGLASEGMGHAIRSKAALSELEKNHKLMVICAGRPYELLSRQFGNVHEIGATTMAYKNNRLNIPGTIKDNLKKAPKSALRNARVMNRISKFKPDIVITDFESLASFYADISGKPLISIDNMQVMKRCDVSYPKDAKANFYFTRKLVSDRIPRADHYIIMSFFHEDVKEKYKGRVTLVPPVLREAVLNAKSSLGNHVIAYQTSDSNVDLPAALKKFPGTPFVVYGFNKDEKDGNVVFRKFDEQRFIDELASSKALIVNGGFTAITEAIYLHKPVLSVPVEKHFEQILNAFYVQREGYGEYAERLTEDVLARFFSKIPEYRENLRRYKQDGNRLAFETLEKKIDELAKKHAGRTETAFSS